MAEENKSIIHINATKANIISQVQPMKVNQWAYATDTKELVVNDVGDVKVAFSSLPASPSGQFLKDDGTWAAAGGAGDDLSLLRRETNNLVKIGTEHRLMYNRDHRTLSGSGLLDTFGKAWAWGYNSEGYLGDGTTVNKSSPVQVVGGHTFVAIAGRVFLSFLGLKSDGTVWAWGGNSNGNLGDNTTVNRSSPVQVVGQSDFVAVAIGNNNCSFGLKSDGTVWAWGGNSNGNLGDNTTVNRSSPVQVVGGHTFVAIAGGTALKADGTVWAWGPNSQGQLGDNSTVSKSSPVQVVGQSDFVAVAINSLALKANGTVWSWGDNSYGQLGDNTAVSKSSPVQVVGQSDFVAVAVGETAKYALKADGTVWAWGENSYGQLGNGIAVGDSQPGMSAPVQVIGQSDFVSVTAGNGCASALKADGTVWAWGGNNYYGFLGDGTTANRSSPVQVVKRFF